MSVRLRLARLAAGLMAALMLPLGVAWGQAGLDPLPTAASHVAILDHDSGLLLHCKGCEAPMPPASMSKLMTALIVVEKLKAGAVSADTMFKVSEKAWRHGAKSDGSHMFLGLGQEARVEDLLRGLIIVSANDACIVLAEGIAGTELAFVDLMNRRAQELGLKSARFRNVTGLPDPDHLISAADLARLASHIIKAHPEAYRIYAEPSLTYNGKTQANRNPLLGAYGGADGVKTGHTSASGYGLIGSATLNGARRIIVFNGMPTMAARAKEAERLMNAAFFDFTVTQAAKAGAPLGEAQVWLGARKTVPVAASEDILLGLHRAEAAGMKAAIVYEAPIPAPIKKGDVIARLVIEGTGEARSYDLAATENVGRANWFARAGAGFQAMTAGRP